MATAQVVYTGVSNSQSVQGTLFGGRKFWLSLRVPQRLRFVELLAANGGIVVKDEKDADIKLVDHTKTETIPNTYSWKYVDLSIRHGVLEDLEDHAIGPRAGSVREAGSNQQPRIGRMPFTAADDAFLYRRVQDHMAQGGKAGGNIIYKQLEEENPRHTWQSWMDRWRRYVSKKPPPLSDGEGGEPPHPDVENSRLAQTQQLGEQHRTPSGAATQDNEIEMHGHDTPTNDGDGTNHQVATEELTDVLTKALNAIRRAKKDKKLRRSDLDAVDELIKAAKGDGEDGISELREALELRRMELASQRILTEALVNDENEEELNRKLDAAIQGQDEEYLLQVTNDILNMAPDQAHKGWSEWTKTFPNRTPQEWRLLFIEKVLPRYHASAANPFRETPQGSIFPSVRTPRSSRAAPSTSEFATQTTPVPHQSSRSLFFQPDTPTIQPRSGPSSGHSRKSNHIEEDSVADSRDPTQYNLPPIFPAGQDSRKRKSSFTAATAPVTPTSGRPHYVKRIRRSEDTEQVPEIPSTPDSHLSLPVRSTPKTVLASPFKSGAVRTPKEVTPMKSMLFDQESDEEDDDAELSSPGHAAAPSQTLSEPSHSPNEIVQKSVTVIKELSSEEETDSLSIPNEDTQMEDQDETLEDEYFETAPNHLSHIASQTSSTQEEEFETAPISTPPRFVQLTTILQSQTPSQTTTSQLDTQAILTGATQPLDLDLAPPPEGWNVHESNDPPSPSTQVHSEAAAQYELDLALAIVPPSPGASPPSVQPPALQSPFSRSPSPQNQLGPNNHQPTEIETPLETYLFSRIRDNVTAVMVQTALKAANMDFALSDAVLTTLEAGLGVPDDVRGVWTDRDDEMLEQSDGRAIKQLIQKHGSPSVDSRFQFLEMWRMSAGDEGEDEDM